MPFAYMKIYAIENFLKVELWSQRVSLKFAIHFQSPSMKVVPTYQSSGTTPVFLSFLPT